MDRFNSVYTQLPTQILLKLSKNNSATTSIITNDTDDQLNLVKLKENRWLTRSILIEMSHTPFATSNGIAQDHLNNLLNLQDALIAEILILNHLPKEVDFDKTKERLQLQILGFLQLLFTESPKLIEFLFSTPVIFDDFILNSLFDGCPALFSCINLMNSKFINTKTSNSFNQVLYYWNLVALLSLKYPLPATLNLCKTILNEISNQTSNSLQFKYHEEDLRIILRILEKMVKAFPFLSKTINHILIEWSCIKSIEKEVKDLQNNIFNLLKQTEKEEIYRSKSIKKN